MSALLHDPTFWVAVAFVIFVVAAGKPIYKALVGGLDAHAEKIRGQLDEARELHEEAQKTLAEYKRKQRDAVADAEAIVNHAKEEAERMRARADERLQESIARREQAAKEKIAQAEAAALKQVRSEAVDIAIAAASKIIEQKLDGKQADALAKQAIDELPSKLN